MPEPIFCSLTPEAIKAGRAGLLPGLAERSTSRERLPDGFRLTLEALAENLQQIARVMNAERQCCRWLRFELVVPSAGAAMTLTLSGPEGARDFLAALFDAGN